jgi:glycosyltransferase involved in cell wall biosynthesis
LRILHVLEPSDGGVARHVHDLARAQIRAGHEVFAAVSPRHGFPKRLRAEGVVVKEVAFRPEMTAIVSDVRSLAPVLGVMRSARPDVVHTHGSKGSLAGRPLGRALRIPVVHSAHGFIYLNQRARPRRGIETRRWLTLNFERALAPLTSVIICVSDWERRNALADRIGRPEQLVVVHNGIEPLEPGAPHPALREVPGDGPLLGFLARFHDQKAPLAFVDALAALRDTGVPVRAALVGEGPLEGAVRSTVERAGLGDRVAVLRFDGDPAPYLAGFDAYVLPSLWESLPIGLLEAMSARLPIVACDVGGVAEVVVHEQTGLLVPPRDTRALADALRRLADDSDAARRMGAAGRARLDAEFTFAAQVRGIDAAYARARRWASASS